MAKRFRYLAVTIFALLVCNYSSFAQKKKRAPDGPGEKIYKHYTGTIGDQKIALDLFYGYQGGSNYGGSNYYYIDKPGMIHFYIGEPPTFDHSETLHAYIDPEDNSLTNDNTDMSAQHIEWTFNIRGNELIGKWYSADKKEQLDIRLKEDYSKSYPFDLVWVNNNITDTNQAGTGMGYGDRYLTVVAAKGTKHEDTLFFTDVLRHFIMPAANPLSFLLPVYNDNGLLVIRKTYHGYTPLQGETTYLCLDVQNKRPLKIYDVLILDNDRLSALLEAAAREKYNLPASKKLSESLVVDKIPVTENIALAHKGINFCYNPGELVKDKEIILFLSYAQLKSMLNPEFAKRINL